MIYKQIAHLPIIFQVDEGIILETPEFLKRNKLVFSRVLVVSGKSNSYQLAKPLIEINGWKNYILGDNTFKNIDHLKTFVEKNRYDLIIAVGGGKVLDSVKRVSYLTNINHLSIPTIISNDGLISPIAVIKNDQDRTESIPGMMPMGVVIDLDIIKNSPINYIRAAAGDILSNLSANNDWVLAYQNEKDRINDIGFHLSKSAANALLHFDHIDLKSKSFLRMVIQGQVNSGIAMSLAGTSRPCSGSEHLISHAIDYLALNPKVLHGTQVASISLFTLFLQNKLKPIHLQYALATEIPLFFTKIFSINSKEMLTSIFEKAKGMRPGRYTVLDTQTSESFIKKIKEYELYAQDFQKKIKTQ